MNERAAAGTSILVASGVTKRYGATVATRDVSFGLNAGHILAVLGPNGAGKSSLFRMLTGYNVPDGGSVTYTDGDGRVHPAIVPADLGYLPEERGLYQDSSVRDVLVYLAQLRGMAHSAALAALPRVLERLGIEPLLGKKVRELSKGNQQKVQLASCLVHSPRILVLDEPFSGLDPRNQEQLVGLLDELRSEGVALIISAHHLPLVERIADDTLILDAGQVVRRVKGRSAQAARNDRFVLECNDEVRVLERLRVEPWLASKRLSKGRLLVWKTGEGNIAALVAALLETQLIESLRVGDPSLHDDYFDAVVSVSKEEQAA